MRIESIQNFAATAFDKCCKPRKSNENISSNNSLERSPAIDTVSFGRFDEKYYPIVRKYAFRRLMNDMYAYDAIRDSIYLNLEPTEETINDLSKNTYKLELVSYKEFRPDDPESDIREIDNVMKGRVKDFNRIYGYNDGWEKSLTTTEDFIKAAELANYLDEHGLFPRGDEGEDDWMRRPFGLDY